MLSLNKCYSGTQITTFTWIGYIHELLHQAFKWRCICNRQTTSLFCLDRQKFERILNATLGRLRCRGVGMTVLKVCRQKKRKEIAFKNLCIKDKLFCNSTLNTPASSVVSIGSCTGWTTWRIFTTMLLELKLKSLTVFGHPAGVWWF